MLIDLTNRYGQGLHSLPIVPMPRTTIAIVVMPGLNLENLFMFQSSHSPSIPSVVFVNERSTAPPPLIVQQ